MFGAIETGGTKIICGVGSAAGSQAMTRIETRDADETLAEVTAFFRNQPPIDALGIASFGPLQLDPSAKDFGRITTTTKAGWSGIDLPARLGAVMGVPVAIDTDVNAAAIAEARQGAGCGARALAYVTIGTGIGVGLVIDGAPVHGLGHPEAGHLKLRRNAAHDGFAGICPYHGDCLEGLASGPAILAAWGESLGTLPADHPAWAAQIDYLGQLCATLILSVAPEHIVLGGGVMSHARLIAGTRARTRAILNGYCTAWADEATFVRRITAPGCIEPPGLVGAYLLAAGHAAELPASRCS